MAMELEGKCLFMACIEPIRCTVKQGGFGQSLIHQDDKTVVCCDPYARPGWPWGVLRNLRRGDQVWCSNNVGISDQAELWISIHIKNYRAGWKKMISWQLLYKIHRFPDQNRLVSQPHHSSVNLLRSESVISPTLHTRVMSLNHTSPNHTLAS